MNSRESILEKLKKQQRKTTLPALPILASGPGDAEAFRQVLTSIGGAVVTCHSPAEVKQFIDNTHTGAPRIVSTVETIAYEQVPQTSTGASLSNVTVAIIRGELGVAENGAVWVSNTNLPNRVLPFICEHLVILLDKDRIVSDMHKAYEAIDQSPYAFGVFIAGPSKTADIEQSLVLGAHGPKSLTVVLLG